MAARSKLHQIQFVDFFHASQDEFPPHTAMHDRRQYIFGGTKESALDRSEVDVDRPYLHHYRIPRSMLRPEIWGDDLHEPDKKWSMENVHHLADDPGPTLWEDVPADPDSVKQGEVMQYRNHHEDKGSISYIIHKQDTLRGGPISYVGVTKLFEPHDSESDDGEREPIRWRSFK